MTPTPPSTPSPRASWPDDTDAGAPLPSAPRSAPRSTGGSAPRSTATRSTATRSTATRPTTPRPVARGRDGRRRERGGFVAYLVGAVAGLVAGPIVIGGFWMLFLFYADWLGDFDTKNDRLSEVIAGSVLASPLIGVLVGIGVVAWRRRRAARRSAPARRGRV